MSSSIRREDSLLASEMMLLVCELLSEVLLVMALESTLLCSSSKREDDNVARAVTIKEPFCETGIRDINLALGPTTDTTAELFHSFSVCPSVQGETEGNRVFVRNPIQK